VSYSRNHGRERADVGGGCGHGGGPSIGKRTLVEACGSVQQTAAAASAPAAQGTDAVRRAAEQGHDSIGLNRGGAARPQQPSHHLTELARMAIAELGGDQRRKVLLSTVLAAKRRGELPAFAAILKATPHGTHGDHFVFLVNELHEDFGSKNTVSILQFFAEDGVDITSQLDTSDLQPLAAVAKFKSVVARFKELVQAGELSEADRRRVGQLIADAEAALRSIEGGQRRPGPQVQQAGGMGVAAAAGAAWKLAGALAIDDVTGIGVADDVAIPFVIVGAAALSAIALVTGGPKPVTLDYGPARAKIEAALRQMADLLAVSTAMAVQGERAQGQLKNVAVHLARLLVLASVGGHPPGEPPKKDDRNDKHWWAEIKASLKAYFQATKGASNKQIMRELLKRGFTEAQIADLEAALARAEQMMGEQLGRIIPPP